MKNLSIFLILMNTIAAQAEPQHPFISIKERLRISLWSEGIETHKESGPKKLYYPVHPNQKRLPEELLKPLMEFPI